MSSNRTVEYELHQNDEVVATVSGPEEYASKEITRYYIQYREDGPCDIYVVVRNRIPMESLDNWARLLKLRHD